MTLQVIWFVLIVVLLAGYLVLDGFDLGVGILHLFARDEDERRTHIQAIAPVWDGNEVWLITGGGALFAAFPAVYASAASAFYLALVLLLLALIARGIGVEFRGKLESPYWRAMWDRVFGLGSLLAALLLGVAYGNILRGLAIDAQGNHTASFLNLLNPFALLMGAGTILLFSVHGASYLLLKSSGPLNQRLRMIIKHLAISSAAIPALALATAALMNGTEWGLFKICTTAAGLILLLSAGLVARRSGSIGQEGRCFAATSVMVLLTAILGAINLFPKMLPSLLDPAFSLTIQNSSTPLTLKTMLIIAAIGVPVVLAYTAWVYWVFRGKVDESSGTY